jgi:Uma2 family endonuclease
VTAGGGIMSVALVDHTRPWTADDVEALPDAGDHARFEVYEGGVLVASPAPGVGHQRASYWLHRALAQAAIAAGADAEGRAVKPVMYAEAGIPVYWRVELQGTPKVVVGSLSRGRYVTRTTLVAGTPGHITRPFAVELDPAELTRRTT